MYPTDRELCEDNNFEKAKAPLSKIEQSHLYLCVLIALAIQPAQLKRKGKLMTDDLFEAARKAFFGTESVTPVPSRSPAPPPTSRNEHSQESEAKMEILALVPGTSR
jgi:hypothetical protein